MDNIHLKFNKNWHRSTSPEAYVRGTAFIESAGLKDAELIHPFPLSFVSNEQWKDTLLSLNGFFSVVCVDQNGLVAAVDRIRSIPLFYGKADGQVYLSDHAEWVRQQVGDKEMDPVARDEFQLVGYVTGKDTLFPNIRQLQAGEMLRVTFPGNEPQIETYRYYRFTHTEPSEWDESTLREELDRVTEASIQRLIKYADGRQIVVPLSGGFDSRLIVTMLKRLGYDNVQAFTYGVSGNRESKYSKKIADALGIKWLFVEYSAEKWREAWKSDDRIRYQQWASGWASLPHIQDWLAVKEMNSSHCVDKNSVFVPGHCCVTGMIPDEGFLDKQFKLQFFVDSLKIKHFNLIPEKKLDNSRNVLLDKRIASFAPEKKIYSNHEFVNNFMQFGWQERQAKFIGNSVRVYEIFDYDWWLPLWDAQFMGFWESVPLSLREGRKWYVRWVKVLYEDQTGKRTLGNAAEPEFLLYLKKIIKIGPDFFYNKIRDLRIRSATINHLLCPTARFPKNEVIEMSRKGFKLNGIEAYYFLHSDKG